MKATDVYSAFTKDRSHTTNNARHIAISHYEHVALGNHLDVKSIYFSDTALAGLFTEAKDGSGQRLFGNITQDTGAHRRHEGRRKAGAPST